MAAITDVSATKILNHTLGSVESVVKIEVPEKAVRITSGNPTP
jgi:hypothetical protein